jgi:Protein of unknown function (DUF4012)
MAGTLFVGHRIMSEFRHLRKVAETDATSVDRSVGHIRSSLRTYRLFAENPVMRAWGFLPGVSRAYKIPHEIGRLTDAAIDALDSGGTTIIEEMASNSLFGASTFVDVAASRRIAAAATSATPRFEKLIDPAEELHELVSTSRILHRWAPKTDRLVQSIRMADRSVRLAARLPEVVGVDADRRYFVALTTPAELRGFQGLVGNYAIIRFRRGSLSVEEVGSNLDLENPPGLSRRVSSGYVDTFGSADFEWLNMNLSPFIDDAGVQIDDAWKAMRRPSIDGVAFLDTVALSELVGESLTDLTSAGGASLSTPAKLQEYLSRGIYFEFGDDQIARKNYQTKLARTLIDRFIGDGLHLADRSHVLATMLEQGRIGYWDGHPGPRGDGLWRSTTSMARNDVVISFNNVAGNKADSYLAATAARSVTLKHVAGNYLTTLDLKLTSTLRPDDASLPDYIRRRLDFGLDAAAPAASVLDVAVTVDHTTNVRALTVNGAEPYLERYKISNDKDIVRLQIEVNSSSPTDLRIQIESHGAAPHFLLPPLTTAWDNR